MSLRVIMSCHTSLSSVIFRYFDANHERQQTAVLMYVASYVSSWSTFQWKQLMGSLICRPTCRENCQLMEWLNSSREKYFLTRILRQCKFQWNNSLRQIMRNIWRVTWGDTKKRTSVGDAEMAHCRLTQEQWAWVESFSAASPCRLWSCFFFKEEIFTTESVNVLLYKSNTNEPTNQTSSKMVSNHTECSTFEGFIQTETPILQKSLPYKGQQQK